MEKINKFLIVFFVYFERENKNPNINKGNDDLKPCHWSPENLASKVLKKSEANRRINM